MILFEVVYTQTSSIHISNILWQIIYFQGVPDNFPLGIRTYMRAPNIGLDIATKTQDLENVTQIVGVVSNPQSIDFHQIWKDII